MDLAIIAGENSGDQHAAEMLAEMKNIRPNISVAAFGGVAFKNSGANLILDMTKFSVGGLYEALSLFSSLHSC
jgi:lipid-A-disaccharide synthase